MRTLRALSALLAAAVVAGAATIPDPEGFAVRMPAATLLVVLGAMALAGHAVPLRRAGLAAGAAALAGGFALLARGPASAALAIGLAVLAAQGAPTLARAMLGRD